MSKEIKIKVWNKQTKSMSKPMTLQEFWLVEYVDFENSVFIQSTGITDKNGVEIFDEDILRWKSSFGDGDKKGLVHFDEGTLTYWCKAETLATLFYQQTNEHYLKKSGFKGDVPEVIGNKFENPELMGGKL